MAGVREPMNSARADNSAAKSDSRLIQECLEGSEEAWMALIDRYKNLIFSIAVRQGLDRQDMVDVFQSVVTDVLTELPRLREPQAFQAWLIRITTHRCFKWKRQGRREVRPENWDEDDWPAEAGAQDDSIHQAQSEQVLRQSLGQLSEQCRELIKMLFYEVPARPYREVAEALDLSIGSIGFTRRKCLDRLRTLLDRAGYE